MYLSTLFRTVGITYLYVGWYLQQLLCIKGNRKLYVIKKIIRYL